MLLHIIDSLKYTLNESAQCIINVHTSCLGASFGADCATNLAFSIGLAFFRLDVMYNTKPFLISGAKNGSMLIHIHAHSQNEHPEFNNCLHK